MRMAQKPFWDSIGLPAPPLLGAVPDGDLCRGTYTKARKKGPGYLLFRVLLQAEALLMGRSR